MKYAAALVAATATVVSADCASKSFEELGNWFCEAVSHIKYTNLGTAGSYKAVTSMNSDGSCDFSDFDFSGPISPLNEEVSIHVRGPTQLKQVAVYNKTTTAKREVKKSHSKRHGHQHLHQKKHEHGHQEKRADMVYATIDGKVQSWENNWFGGAAATPVAEASSAAAAAVSVATGEVDPIVKSSKASKSSSSSGASSTGAAGDFTRVAYYNAEQQVSDGLTFLGAHGDPAVSGTWDYTFGSSLSYLNSQGTGGAASSEILADVLVPSNNEYVIMSDKECDGDCGYVRPGSVAYHGFAGADRVMLFEFQMPYDGDRGFNGDMPALWLLNAKIPRTLQYGDCSCWPNCGEADIFEVLASGDSKCKSTLHINTPGGSSDYFDRPADKTVKVAVVTQSDSSSMSIKVLDDDFDFSTGLTSDQVEDMVDEVQDLGLSSLFSLVS